MACSAGINMMESRLVEVEGTKHFLTKRFGRDATGKAEHEDIIRKGLSNMTEGDLRELVNRFLMPKVNNRD